MKRVILISAILVALACQPAHATSDVEAMVRAIAQAEELVPQRIANRPYDDVNSGRLVISDAEILPATGLYRGTITYYYDSDMDEEINMHYYLYYVTIDLTFCSNLYHHSMTFFYDEPGLPRHVRYVTGRGVDEDFEADSTIDAYLDEFGHVAFKHEDLSTAEMAVEPLDTGKTGAGDGFQVGVDTFLGNVAADEVKPGLWVEDLVRLEESGLVRGGEGGGQYGGIGGDVHRLPPQGGRGTGQERERGQGRKKGTAVFHINIMY